MGVDHRPHVQTAPVHGQVHFGLRGGMAVSLQHVALQIRHQQHIRCQASLGDPGGRHQQPVRRRFHGEIAVIGGHIPPVVEEFSHGAHQRPLRLIGHTAASFALLFDSFSV